MATTRGPALAVVLVALGAVACGGPTTSTTAASTPSSSSVAPAPTTSTPATSAPPTSAPPTTGVTVEPDRRRVVVLDPGHNGGNSRAVKRIAKPVDAGGFTKPCNTTGTETNSGYGEHEFTFDVAKRAQKLLEAQGVRVVMTRSSDDDVGPCVDERAAIANRAKADLAVSVHADGGSASARGFHVIEPDLSPDRGNAKILAPSAAAAQSLLKSFAKATGEKRATYVGARVEPGLTRRSDLAGLNLARVPAVMIECANLRNSQDAALARSAGWRQKAAQGIADGILAYLARPGT